MDKNYDFLDAECHNFIKEYGYFHHTKFLNEKADLQALNVRWKIVTTWTNRIKQCTSVGFSTPLVVHKEFT